MPWITPEPTETCKHPSFCGGTAELVCDECGLACQWTDETVVLTEPMMVTRGIIKKVDIDPMDKSFIKLRESVAEKIIACLKLDIPPAPPPMSFREAELSVQRFIHNKIMPHVLKIVRETYACPTCEEISNLNCSDGYHAPPLPFRKIGTIFDAKVEDGKLVQKVVVDGKEAMVFETRAADHNVDREFRRYTPEALDQIAEMSVDKPVTIEDGALDPLKNSVKFLPDGLSDGPWITERPITQKMEISIPTENLPKPKLKCQDCGSQIGVIETFCPYDSEINETETRIVVCNPCYRVRAMDI